MIRVLIIDDDKVSMKSAFDLANSIYLDNQFSFEYASRSQDVTYDALKSKYDIIGVDITLANKSEMNGYQIIKKISDTNLFPISKVFILTGNSQVEAELKRIGINNAIEIVHKPVTFDELAVVLQKISD